MNFDKPCYECGHVIDRERDPRAKFCWDCSAQRDLIRQRVSRAVKRAIAAGLLTNLYETHVPCADCGKRADRYDHRDYLRPLDVDPVCPSCNQLRGHALPFLRRLEESA